MTLHLGQSLWLRLQFLQDILSVCLSDAEVGGRRREPGNEEEKKNTYKRQKKVLPFHVKIKSIVGVKVSGKLLNLQANLSSRQTKQTKQTATLKLYSGSRYLLKYINHYVYNQSSIFILHNNANLLIKNNNQHCKCRDFCTVIQISESILND